MELTGQLSTSFRSLSPICWWVVTYYEMTCRYRSKTFFLIVLVLPHGSESLIAIRRRCVRIARWKANESEPVPPVIVPVLLAEKAPAVAVA